LTTRAIERAATPLRVGGLTPLSTTDWPGQLSAVVFCQGCPWRCAYCHNPHLLRANGPVEIAWDDVLAFLHRREGLLDGVVFSGGEPLAQRGLPDAMRTVRRMGFRIGLHTAGAYPPRLLEVLPLIDWVGLDIKAPFETYSSITGIPGSGADALASAKLIIDSGVAYEFRTTVHPRQLAPQAVESLVDELARLGARHYALQEFRAQGCRNAELTGKVVPSFLDESFGAGIAPRFESFQLRRAA
jgi:pyruvate formate lyase activating enzyme